MFLNVKVKFQDRDTKNLRVETMGEDRILELLQKVIGALNQEGLVITDLDVALFAMRDGMSLKHFSKKERTCSDYNLQDEGVIEVCIKSSVSKQIQIEESFFFQQILSTLVNLPISRNSPLFICVGSYDFGHNEGS
jgi:hypothetical protein